MGQEILEIQMEPEGQMENQGLRLAIKKMGEPETIHRNTSIKGLLIINPALPTQNHHPAK